VFGELIHTGAAGYSIQRKNSVHVLKDYSQRRPEQPQLEWVSWLL